MQLTFLADAAQFLAAAGSHLAASPVVSTIVATVAHRALSDPADDPGLPVRTWWLVVKDARGQVVGAGMRTAPFAPYPPFLLPMPDEAALAVAHAVHERGEEVLGVNGTLPAVALFADELARLEDGRVEVSQHTRLHELGELVPPAPVPGGLVPATEEHLDLVEEWLAAFSGDADEQAGRARGSSAHVPPDRVALRRRVRAGEVWLWVDQVGEPVHLTTATAPSFGVARVDAVYTPPDQRGRGWASNAVAEVSRQVRSDGARVCLFTDQANPTSNRIYTALGYRPVVDMVDLVIHHWSLRG